MEQEEWLYKWPSQTFPSLENIHLERDEQESLNCGRLEVTVKIKINKRKIKSLNNNLGIPDYRASNASSLSWLGLTAVFHAKSSAQGGNRYFLTVAFVNYKNKRRNQGSKRRASFRSLGERKLKRDRLL